MYTDMWFRNNRTQRYLESGSLQVATGAAIVLVEMHLTFHKSYGYREHIGDALVLSSVIQHIRVP